MFVSSPTFHFAFTSTLNEDEYLKWAASFVHNRNDLHEFLVDQIRIADPLFRSILGKSVGNGEFMDEINILESLKIPLAIIHGKFDQIASYEYLSQVKFEKLWQGQIQLLHFGHSSQLEASVEFNKLIINFLSEL